MRRGASLPENEEMEEREIQGLVYWGAPRGTLNRALGLPCSWTAEGNTFQTKPA